MFAKNGNLLVNTRLTKPRGGPSTLTWVVLVSLEGRGCGAHHKRGHLSLCFPHMPFLYKLPMGQLCGTVFSICRISPDFQYQSFYRHEILQKYIDIMISYIIISESNVMRHRHGGRPPLPHSSNDSETDCPFLPTPLLGGKKESPFSKGSTIKCGLKPLLDMSYLKSIANVHRDATSPYAHG